MKHSADEILSILDECANAFTFPMLDNGYVNLAATRLSLFRSEADWAMTIEIFGFSPRAGIPLPSPGEYEAHGISFMSDGEIWIFELCRLLAAIKRSDVLATAQELRVNVPTESKMILQLDEWNHPDVVDDACRPSGSEAFRQLAGVLVTGKIDLY
jgi:hypothetical protein